MVGGNTYEPVNMLSTYQNKVLLTVGINIILAVSLNVATGYLGQLPLGHAGFMAVGAYACALFTKSSGLPKGVAFAIGLVLAWVIAGLFGVLIGIPALRLTGDYLAILTLGFGEIIRITVLPILPESTRSFDSYRMVVYSLVLVLMMIFRPGGLLGSYDFSLSRIVEKAMNGELFRKHTKKEAADHE